MEAVMLGHHHGPQVEMTHQGIAKVVTCDLPDGAMSMSGPGFHLDEYDLILDVYPEGADAFRTETRHYFPLYPSPSPGDTLRVLCNPQLRAVEIDLSQDTRFNWKLINAANEANRLASHERDLQMPPGTPPLGPG
jgi:hypothetical protein